MITGVNNDNPPTYDEAMGQTANTHALVPIPSTDTTLPPPSYEAGRTRQGISVRCVPPPPSVCALGVAGAIFLAFSVGANIMMVTGQALTFKNINERVTDSNYDRDHVKKMLAESNNLSVVFTYMVLITLGVGLSLSCFVLGRQCRRQ